MLPEDDYKSRKNDFGLTLEGVGNRQFSVLATSLETLETVSMRAVYDHGVYRFSMPKTKKGGIIITKRFSTLCGVYEICFIFVREGGEVDLKHHWIPEIDSVSCAIVLRGIKPSEGYCLKIKVGDNIYLSDALLAKGGDYIVSDTKLLCQFLVGEVDESALIAAAEKQAEEVSLRQQLENVTQQHDHNLLVLKDSNNRLEKTVQALQDERKMAANAYGYITILLSRVIRKRPWTKKGKMIRSGLEAAQSDLERIPTIKKD